MNATQLPLYSSFCKKQYYELQQRAVVAVAQTQAYRELLELEIRETQLHPRGATPADFLDLTL